MWLPPLTVGISAIRYIQNESVIPLAAGTGKAWDREEATVTAAMTDSVTRIDIVTTPVIKATDDGHRGEKGEIARTDFF